MIKKHSSTDVLILHTASYLHVKNIAKFELDDTTKGTEAACKYINV